MRMPLAPCTSGSMTAAAVAAPWTSRCRSRAVRAAASRASTASSSSQVAATGITSTGNRSDRQALKYVEDTPTDIAPTVSPW